MELLKKKLQNYQKLVKSIEENYEKAKEGKNVAVRNALFAEIKTYNTVISELTSLIEKEEINHKKELETIKSDFSTCEGLLSEAHDYMDNTHGYDTDLYREINKYFEN